MSKRLKGKELNDQQLLFCQEYVVDLNATQAAIRAGYSKKTAQEQASRLLSNVMVQQKIQELLGDRLQKAEIKAAEVLKELKAIALSDLRRIFKEDGSLLPPSEWPDEMAKTISSIEVFEEYEGKGDFRELVGFTKKIKLWDKIKSLELLGKYLKIFTEKVDLTSNGKEITRVILKLPENGAD